MSKYARRRNKKGVAERATPEQRLRLSPISESLSALPDAKSVLRVRHLQLESLDLLSYELGGMNRGTLSAVENGKREPSDKLIKKLNNIYGCHLHKKTAKIIVEICPLCGGLPTPRHRCPGATTKYAPHPVMRISHLKAILTSPYRDS